MRYQGDVGLYLSGGQVPVKMCNVFITQPTIKQIVSFGETNFFMALHLFTKLEDVIKELKQGNLSLEELSNFQILLVMAKEDQQTQYYLEHFFSLICPNYIIKYNKNSIDFFQETEEENKLVGQVSPFTFENFALTLDELFGIHGSGEVEEYNPANDKAKEIMDKIKRGRDRVRKQRGESEGGEKMSIFANYTSILAAGMNMDINIFYNYTPFQLFDAFVRYTNKIRSDLYQKIATTPLMDASKIDEPEDWMRNLYQME